MSEMYPLIDVVALLIGRDGRLLLDYNEPWSAFCLPITKLRDVQAQVPDGEGRRETPQEAAVRAAVEVLGIPLAPDRLPKPVESDIPPYQQSGSDGQWKRYKFHLFSMTIHFEPQPLAGHSAAWLKPEEILTHQPMSPTLPVILKALGKDVLAKLLTAEQGL